MMRGFRVSGFGFRAAALGRIVLLSLPVLVVVAEDGMDPRGEPSVLRGIFGIALLIFGPLVGGIVFGLLQLGLYRVLAVLGAVTRESIPIFPVFLLRGLIIMVALVAAGLFYIKASGRSVPWDVANPPAISP